MHVFDHALLDFFYVDHMLRPGGIVAFDDADLPAVRRVVRYVLTNRDYAVKACLDSDAPPRSAAGRAVERFAHTGPGGRITKPELRRSDRELGLTPSTRCAALVKLGDDSRAWDFH